MEPTEASGEAVPRTAGVDTRRSHCQCTRLFAVSKVGRNVTCSRVSFFCAPAGARSSAQGTFGSWWRSCRVVSSGWRGVGPWMMIVYCRGVAHGARFLAPAADDPTLCHSYADMASAPPLLAATPTAFFSYVLRFCALVRSTCRAAGGLCTPCWI